MYYINNSISVDTRFDPMKFFHFNVDNVDPLNAFMITNIKKLPSIGTYTVLKEEKRPDLISYKLYDDTQYWWILLVYNDILDISNLKSGTIISYPDKAYFETLYQRASLLRKTT